MIKIRYPLFRGRRNVLECNFVDLQRGVGADTVEEPRGGWGFGCGAHCAERVSIAPDCLNPPPPVHSLEQLGANQSSRHWPRDQLLKTSHEFGLAVRVDCCAHVGENSLAHAAPFPSVPGYRSVLPDRPAARSRLDIRWCPSCCNLLLLNFLSRSRAGSPERFQQLGGRVAIDFVNTLAVGLIIPMTSTCTTAW